MAGNKKLIVKEIPLDILEVVKVDSIHKCVKSGASLIVIHTTTHIKRYFRKHGTKWLEVESKEGSVPKFNFGMSNNHLKGGL